MPAFSTALYYPCTEAPADKWLKNAILYWDKIKTIVPRGDEKPYETETALTLYDNGLLEPLFVDSDMPEIVELSDQVLNYLDSPAAKSLLKPKNRFVKVRSSKARFSRRAAPSNNDKLHSQVKQLVRKPPSSLDGWLEFDERFADFYLTLLATRLSDNRGFGLLADQKQFDQLALTAKLDSVPSLSPEGKKVPKQLAQGMLANLVIERLEIDPETPIDKLLKFRRKYADELGRFRTNTAELTEKIEGDLALEALRQQVSDIYINQYLPAFNAFTKALEGSKIKFLAESLLRVSFFSLPITSAAVVFAGTSVSHPVLIEIGAAATLALSTVSYNIDRTNHLKQSPYQYVLEARKKL